MEHISRIGGDSWDWEYVPRANMNGRTFLSLSFTACIILCIDLGEEQYYVW